MSNLILLTCYVTPVPTDNMAQEKYDVKDNNENCENFNENNSNNHTNNDNVPCAEYEMPDNISEIQGTTLSIGSTKSVEGKPQMVEDNQDNMKKEVFNDGSMLPRQEEEEELHFQRCNKLHFQKCKKLHLNNNINYNNTNIIHSSNIYHLSEDEDFMSVFKNNIDYNILKERRSRKGDYSQILSMIMKAVNKVARSAKKSYRVSGEIISRNILYNRLLELDSTHIEYVIECIQGSSTLIRDINSYMLTCLYNAPETIDDYYTYQVIADRKRLWFKN